MKKTIRELYELQNGSGWNENWQVTHEEIVIGEIVWNEDNGGYWALYDKGNDYIDFGYPEGDEKFLTDDTELDVMLLVDPDALDLIIADMEKMDEIVFDEDLARWYKMERLGMITEKLYKLKGLENDAS